MTITAKQRALGQIWCEAEHYEAPANVRNLLTDWIIARYMRDIAGKYTVELVDRDPYESDAELRCRVSNSKHIQALRWTPQDCLQHFLSPEVGQLYQIYHDVTHHAERDWGFDAEGERLSSEAMLEDLAEFAKERGYAGHCLRDASQVLLSHTYLRVLGILFLLERDGNLDNYEHKIVNLAHA